MLQAPSRTLHPESSPFIKTYPSCSQFLGNLLPLLKEHIQGIETILGAGTSALLSISARALLKTRVL